MVHLRILHVHNLQHVAGRKPEAACHARSQVGCSQNISELWGILRHLTFRGPKMEPQVWELPTYATTLKDCRQGYDSHRHSSRRH